MKNTDHIGFIGHIDHGATAFAAALFAIHRDTPPIIVKTEPQEQPKLGNQSFPLVPIEIHETHPIVFKKKHEPNKPLNLGSYTFKSNRRK
jgi:hypothetical protein